MYNLRVYNRLIQLAEDMNANVHIYVACKLWELLYMSL